MQREDPWHDKNCQRVDCIVCKYGGGECEKEGVGYSIYCEECGEELISVEYCYEGETSSNAYYRGKKHMELYHKKSLALRNKSFMWKHAQEKHNSRLDVNYKMKVLQHYLGDPLGRQNNEAVRIRIRIDEKPETRLLNSGGEWHLAHIPRLNPTH